LGAAAALIGMLVQSNFSFVFHLLPGTLLLGVCLARASSPNPDSGEWRFDITRKVLLGMISALSLAFTLPLGWKGTQVLLTVWPAFFGKNVSNIESISALSRGIDIWPQATFYRERAILSHRSTLGRAITSPTNERGITSAIEDYYAAAKLHPFDLNIAINLGNLLSLVGRDAEAETQFQHAIVLQGGMEAAYKANLFLSEHYARKAKRELDLANYETALPTLLLGVTQLELLEQEMPGITKEPRGIVLRQSLFSNLAITYEHLGDPETALIFTDKAAAIPGNSSAHYQASLIIGNLAKTAWSERRPSEALARFLEARKRMDLAIELPSGITSEIRAEYVAFLDRSIQYLVEAKVEPLIKADD